MKEIYDVIIIGGGPGGYSAALYATRAGLNTLVIEKLSPGGQMTQTTQIDNYPGFDEGIDGFALGAKMKAGAERFGAKTKSAEVVSVNLTEKIKEIATSDGTFFAKAVIIATGADHRHLGLPSEEQFAGKGVAYCAACDGMFYRGKTVAVIGGGNSAVADASLLSRICKEVILIHRRDTLRATKIYHDQLEKSKNVTFRWNSVVTEFTGDSRISGLKTQNIVTGETDEIPVDGVFISIGRNPVTHLFKGQIALDENSYILAGEDAKTNLPGVFAVGDVRTKALRQVVTAAADGAIAAHYTEEYLLNHNL